ncbi:MAG TPA: DNA alkylation repair protein [Armatimonadota bacterium]|nr:DNA alkylation repair protein [Armatimonadota bacterium]
MLATEIVTELEPLGKASYKKVLLNHGVREPVFGVKIDALKSIRKRTRTDYQLALDLYATGIYDAQYLAGLIADETRMTVNDLRRWLATSNCRAISTSAVAWVAAESRHGRELAVDWIESNEEDSAQAGWATLSSLVAVADDSRLDLDELERLLGRVERTIHQQPNYVRYSMNGFVIALGSYVRELTGQAIRAGEKIGPVSVDMGNTACSVPYAPAYIEKVRLRGAIGKKRKTARC